MSTLQIQTNGQICIDHKSTQWMVRQDSDATVVWNADTLDRLRLPHVRYSLSTDNPASGVAGRAKFAADFIAASADYGA